MEARLKDVPKRLRSLVDWDRHGDSILLIVLIFGLAITYGRWFIGGVFMGNDYPVTLPGALKEASLLPLWISNAGLGTVDPVFWRPTFNIIPGLLSNLFGGGLERYDTFLVFGMWILVSVIPIYYLAKLITRSRTGATIAALVFSCNSYFLAINSQGHLLLSIAAGFLTLSLLIWIRFIQNPNAVRAVCLALSMAITGWYDIRFLYIAIGTLLLYLIFELLFDRPRTGKKMGQIARFSTLSAVILILLNLFWILPFTKSGGTESILARGLFGSNFWNTTDALTLRHPFWSGGTIDWFSVTPRPFYFWFIPLLALVGFWLNRQQRKIVFFAVLAIIGIFLSKQADDPLNGAYNWLYETIPGFRAFREATKFYILIVLGYSILIGALAARLASDPKADQQTQPNGRFKSRKIRHGLAIASIAGIIMLFVINLWPIVNGTIGQLYTSRSMPSDYATINERISSDPSQFRTLWLPRDSYWGESTIQHPRVSAAYVLDNQWRDLLPDNAIANDATARSKITQFMTQPYANDILDRASIKYVIVPALEPKNDDDLFKYYGGERAYYLRLLDGLGYLKRIDTGQQSIAVYENTGWQPTISAQPYPLALDSIHAIGAISQIFSNRTDPRPLYYESNVANSPLPTAQAFELFSGAMQTSSSNASILDTLLLASPRKASLYRNNDDSTIWYQTNNESLQFMATLPTPITYNGNQISQSNPSQAWNDPQTIGESAFSPQNKTYLSYGSSFLPVKVNTKQPVSTIQSTRKIDVQTSQTNLVSDGSFEEKLWADKVGDCNNYDNRPDISMVQTHERSTEGSSSLQLRAKRHNACLAQDMTVQGENTYVLQLDFTSAGNNGGYYIEFNDPARTKVEGNLRPAQPNNWQTIATKITAPKDATEATLYLYAYESDGRTDNLVLYDNVWFGSLSTDSSIAVAPVQPTFTATRMGLDRENIFSLSATSFANNIIKSGDFETGGWQSTVQDCNNYDAQPIIAMRLEQDEPLDGTQSLSLSAQRHNACTYKTFSLPTAGTYGFSAMTKSLGNAQYAGAHIKLNDGQQTSYTYRWPIDATKQTFSQTFNVPTGAQQATITLYSFESEGTKENRVLYDNVRLVPLPEGVNAYRLITDAPVASAAPKSMQTTQKHSTRYDVSIKNISQSFMLNFNNAYHPQWRLYLMPVNEPTQNCDKSYCLQLERPNLLEDASLSNNPAIDTSYHVKTDGYSNGWFIDPSYITTHFDSRYYQKQADGSISIRAAVYFYPQSLAIIGSLVSLATLASCTTFLAWRWYAKRS